MVYGFAIGAAFSGVVCRLLSIMGNRVWCRFTPHGRHIDYNNVYYQNLELPLMVVNVFVEIALPIAKWELTFVVMLKRRKHCVLPV
jgi:hypothetical protein